MIKEQHLVADINATFSRHLGLSIKFVRQVVSKLKMHDRIESARPNHPPVTAGMIARILFGLTSTNIRDAAEIEKALGALPIYTGDGQPTLEVQLTDLVQEAIGTRYGDTDFRDGQILVGHSTGVVIANGSIYRAASAPEKPGVQKFTAINHQAIARIARDLMGAAR